MDAPGDSMSPQSAPATLNTGLLCNRPLHLLPWINCARRYCSKAKASNLLCLQGFVQIFLQLRDIVSGKPFP